MPINVGFLASHPIQYHAPVFRELAKQSAFDFKVYFAHRPTAKEQGSGFNVPFQWTIPVLDGYEHTFLENRSLTPSVIAYNGCDTPTIRSVLKHDQIDVLIINGWNVKSCVQGLFGARKLGIPVIVRGENNLLRKRPWPKRLMHRILLRYYSAFCAIGQANREYLLQHGVPENRIFHTPYCVDNDFFSQQSNRTEVLELRERLQAFGRKFTFTFCGKLEEKKHPVELIRTFRNTFQDNDGVQLLIVGDGPLRKECEREIGEEDRKIVLLGFLNQGEIRAAYAMTDCLVLPSDAGETWGLVVNEAFAAGRTAIVSDAVGCCRDLILEGRTGLKFKDRNWNDLSRALRILALDKELSDRLGANAKKLIDSYSAQVAANGFVSAVSFVLQGRQ